MGALAAGAARTRRRLSPRTTHAPTHAPTHARLCVRRERSHRDLLLEGRREPHRRGRVPRRFAKRDRPLAVGRSRLLGRDAHGPRTGSSRRRARSAFQRQPIGAASPDCWGCSCSTRSPSTASGTWAWPRSFGAAARSSRMGHDRRHVPCGAWRGVPRRAHHQTSASGRRPPHGVHHAHRNRSTRRRDVAAPGPGAQLLIACSVSRPGSAARSETDAR